MLLIHLETACCDLCPPALESTPNDPEIIVLPPGIDIRARAVSRFNYSRLTKNLRSTTTAGEGNTRAVYALSIALVAASRQVDRVPTA